MGAGTKLGNPKLRFLVDVLVFVLQLMQLIVL
jgi:hypothetical protein